METSVRTFGRIVEQRSERLTRKNEKKKKTNSDPRRSVNPALILKNVELWHEWKFFGTRNTTNDGKPKNPKKQQKVTIIPLNRLLAMTYFNEIIRNLSEI